MSPITLCTAILGLLILCAAQAEHDADKNIDLTCSGSTDDYAAGGGALTQTRSRRHWQQLSLESHAEQREKAQVASLQPAQVDLSKFPDSEKHPHPTSGSLPANSTALFEVVSPRTFTYSTFEYSVVSASEGIFGASGSIAGGFIGGILGGLAASGWISYYSRAIVGVMFGATVGGISGWAIDNVVMPALNMSREVSPENTTIQEVLLDPPITEKLRHLAEEVETVSTYAGNFSAKDFKAFAGHSADAEAAHKALQHIKNATDKDMANGIEELSKEGAADVLNALEVEGESNSLSLQDPIANGSRPRKGGDSLADDFEQLTEILTHPRIADFLISAQVAVLNEAVITDQDVAMLEPGPRAADVGPRNGTEHLQALEGDMLYDQALVGEMLKTKEKRIAAGRPWTGATVNYCFASDVSKRVKKLFEAGARQYTKAVPCLHFNNVGWKKGSSTSFMEDQWCQESPAIFVSSNPTEGCYSWVGMVPNMRSQRLQLQDPGCYSWGIVLHEIGHALGMEHEHSRTDRDDHIRVIWENIRSDAQAEFDIVQKSGVAQEYDLFSIMHYDNYAFSMDGSKATIEALDQETRSTVGQRNGLAMADIQQVKYMYNSQSPHCTDTIGGIGCLDAKNTDGPNGTDVCNSLTSCGPSEVQMCCACGGGVKVQCYKGGPCPQAKQLEVDANFCLQDVTELYSGSHGCIYRNTCNFNVSFKCPEMECTHTASARSSRASYCGTSIQSGVCKGRCQVWRSS